MLATLFIAAALAMPALQIAAVARVTRRAPRRASTPITVLKPIAGRDPALEACLATFFVQDHPDYELVFGIEGGDDPALPIVAALCDAHPHVHTRIVVHRDVRGINPKVRNLRAMMVAASHDLVVVSDSNIAVAPSYLSELCGELEVKGTGLVTNLFVSEGPKTIGAGLEALHLGGAVASMIALPTEVFDHPIVVGKSMAFRVSDFERLGGWNSVADLLAEDYVIGRMFKEAGYAIRIAPAVVRNIGSSIRVRDFAHRQLRWAMIRARLNPLAHFLEPLAMPAILTGLASLFGANPIAMAILGGVLTTIRDAAVYTMLRGPKGLNRALAVAPLRDAIVLAVWAAAPFVRRVKWRGRSVRVSAGTRLYLEASR